MNLLDQREKDVSHVPETVLLAAVENISSTAQGSHFVNQVLFTTFFQHNIQHLRDGGLAAAGLPELRTKSRRGAN